MKKQNILLFLLFTFSHFLFGQENNEIIGKWILIKIDFNYQIIQLDNDNYYLNITNEKISYKLEYNTCFSKEYTITKDSINSKYFNCTEICCDTNLDKKINYNGKYSLTKNDNTLIIENEIGIYYLKRDY